MNKIKELVGQEFLWTFRIINNGEKAWPNRVFLFRIIKAGHHEQLSEINKVKAGEKISITVGFKVKNRNAVEMYDLRLGFIDIFEGVVFFGPKFGFEIDSRESVHSEKII